MFKNKSLDNRNNLCGKKIYEIRKCDDRKMSQRALADALQLEGIDLDKNAIQRIENGKRYVTDIELKALSKVLNVSYEDLLSS